MRKREGKPMKRKLVSIEEFAAKVGVNESTVMEEIRQGRFHKSVVHEGLAIKVVFYDGIFEWHSKDDTRVDRNGIPRYKYGDIRGAIIEAIKPDDDYEEAERAGNN